MKKPLNELVQQEGYCCPFAYIICNTDLTTKQMADELKVNSRTIRSYKQKIKEGNCSCGKYTFCLFLTEEALLKTDTGLPQFLPEKAVETLRRLYSVKREPSRE